MRAHAAALEPAAAASGCCAGGMVVAGVAPGPRQPAVDDVVQLAVVLQEHVVLPGHAPKCRLAAPVRARPCRCRCRQRLLAVHARGVPLHQAVELRHDQLHRAPQPQLLRLLLQPAPLLRLAPARQRAVQQHLLPHPRLLVLEPLHGLRPDVRPVIGVQLRLKVLARVAVVVPDALCGHPSLQETCSPVSANGIPIVIISYNPKFAVSRFGLCGIHERSSC
mmetsp:Transcript_19200/g.48836  ORF Transcript_19200/g.48836 Transcript_19200/m.48836 type:complete len:221 (+) Transcript_19200:1531-2193(+)